MKLGRMQYTHERAICRLDQGCSGEVSGVDCIEATPIAIEKPPQLSD